MAEIREWHWGNQGVDLYDDHLVWYEDLGPVAFASGAGSVQTFAEFAAHGPNYAGIPPGLLAELTAAVAEKLKG